MMTGLAFSDAVESLMANDDLAVDGIFTPQDESPRDVRLVITRNDKEVRLLTTGTRSPGWRASIRAREVPERPMTGDLLTVSAGRFAGDYAVLDVREDPLGLTWDVDLNAT